ncbi:hypothetical protein ACFYNZ_34420 [Streptomyces kebangsaanensis]|uniref:LexA repressor DNA-binding domain-containing protein n=1 Tax=Streptomyces kebangsaanensis TaxID=864058 RepID=A0ABW6L2Z5_9ACTN
MNRHPVHLTEREEEILRCVRRWIKERGEGPSVRQLARAIGMRTGAIGMRTGWTRCAPIR